MRQHLDQHSSPRPFGNNFDLFFSCVLMQSPKRMCHILRASQLTILKPGIVAPHLRLEEADIQPVSKTSISSLVSAFGAPAIRRVLCREWVNESSNQCPQPIDSSFLQTSVKLRGCVGSSAVHIFADLGTVGFGSWSQ